MCGAAATDLHSPVLFIKLGGDIRVPREKRTEKRLGAGKIETNPVSEGYIFRCVMVIDVQ